jgi:hypothetical protein
MQRLRAAPCGMATFRLLFRDETLSARQARLQPIDSSLLL